MLSFNKSTTAAKSQKTTNPKTLTGKVVSTKMTKTVVVEVTRLVRHPIYGKYIRTNKRYKAHNEDKALKEGDAVKIIETPPISKQKHWRVVEKLSS